ncbi:DUF1353 domain-containing protein [Nocardioides sp. Root151]|uniref:DUF1353 domain-containing protein n=1 Tax=Nocardioides sp. Root151 TaxID=1736475 RepID=UPI000703BCE5|nr:DUF1353 domain-containing protein [Nocardioides sp. Root151]KQZ75194.1 hypothetical protein ASD66_02135 [Nocardioides sp. Root151]
MKISDAMVGQVEQVEQETRRFYDGGLPAVDGQPEVPPNPGEDPKIVLERLSVQGHEQFALIRRIAYRDRHLGELLVPADTVSFRTDLTSVPMLFTWLVPKTGAHLPAALLHDGLCFADDEPPTYTSTDGHMVHRVEADRIFRDAMADTGTGVVRRWLVWSAVATATLLKGEQVPWSTATTWRHRIVIGASLFVVVVLGVLATLDLFDIGGSPELPWMGDRPWWLELVGGLAGAIVVPLVLGLAWGRFRMAGWVMGIGLAVLLHVTVGLLGVTALYQVTEKSVDRQPLIVAGVAVLVSILATGTVIALWVL